MTCGLSCSRRILREVRVPRERLVGLEVLRQRIPEERLTQLIKEASITWQPGCGTCGRLSQDPFTACFLYLCRKDALQAYVPDRQYNLWYRIRSEVCDTACRCWSAVDSIREARFIAKPSLLCQGSIDAMSDGKPIYVPEEADRAFGLRPTSRKRLTAIITAVITEASDGDLVLTKKQLVQTVMEHPEVRGVSKAQIEGIAQSVKPQAWSSPGRRLRAPHQ